jgi:type VI protein secretion system component VasK
MTLAEFGTGQLVWSMLWFVMFIAWCWVVIVVLGDILHSEDLGGWGKTLWIVFVVAAIWLGVLVYVIVRGKGMQHRDVQTIRTQAAAEDTYIRRALSAQSGESSS